MAYKIDKKEFDRLYELWKARKDGFPFQLDK